MVNVFYESVSTNEDGTPGTTEEVNVHAVKSIVGSLDASWEDPVQFWRSQLYYFSTSKKASGEKCSRIINIYDHRLLAKISIEKLPTSVNSLLSTRIPATLLAQAPTTHIQVHPENGRALNLLRIKDGDRCARCSIGTLKVQKAVELGHTFFLGTRYSKPLRAYVSRGNAISPKEDSGTDTLPSETSSRIPLQMGCHGIGVSRMIGVVANSMADETGLNWPRVMAPFEVVIIARKGYDEAAVEVYDALSNINTPSPTSQENITHHNPCSRLDVVLDDRQKDFIPKLIDAELIGIPVIVVLGRAWEAGRGCEVLCRRLAKLRAEISLEDLPSYVTSLLERL